jgi:hypothetical protein
MVRVTIDVRTIIYKLIPRSVIKIWRIEWPRRLRKREAFNELLRLAILDRFSKDYPTQIVRPSCPRDADERSNSTGHPDQEE